jgi:hypothetical protein
MQKMLEYDAYLYDPDNAEPAHLSQQPLLKQQLRDLVTAVPFSARANAVDRQVWPSYKQLVWHRKTVVLYYY